MADIRMEKPPSAAVMAARSRREERAAKSVVRTEWFIENVLNRVNVSLAKRVAIATEYVRSKVTINISRPVTKSYFTVIRETTNGKGQVKTKRISYVRVTDRSKPGEFPKADTTLLMKSLLTDVSEPIPNVHVGRVGTPLDYGVILELRRDRSFLLRTLNEERAVLLAILGGPMT